MYKIVLLFSFFLLTACDKELGEAEQKLIDTKPECEDAVVEKSYLAKWKSGEVTKVTAEDREDLIENFVKPNLEDLDFVEHEQMIRVELPEADNSSLSPMAPPPEWGQDKINAKYAWDRGIAGQNIVVAVIDSGVETSHSLLQDNIFVNASEANGAPGVDDDHNGFVDDVRGWNFVDNSGHNSDEIGHGTHVAGIIGSKHSSSVAVGVAPSAKILPIDFMNNAGGTTADAILAIEYAKNMNAKVINASWGGTVCSKALKAAVEDLANSDVLFISAAGNSGRNISFYPEYPAAFNLPKQLTIGASTTNNYLAAFSNYGRLVDLVAPGNEVYSTYVGNGYRVLSGTSMATPFVAGVAALLWSAKPQATAVELRNAIMGGVIQGFYDVESRGQLNVPNALGILN